MVVSNRKGSIYGRIWCSYEAYLAYTLDKRIFCATSPVHDFRPRVVSQLGVCIVGLGIGTALCILIVFCSFEHFAGTVLNLLIGGVIITKVAYSVLRKTPASIACRLSCAVAAHVAGVCVGFILQMDNTLPINWVVAIIVLAFGFCLEADRLWAVEAVRERANLCSGYTGHVCDAVSSVPEDGEHIRGLLREQSQEFAVDHCVEVLIRTGLSTSHLRIAAERAGRLGNASNWYTASVVMQAGGIWIWLPAQTLWVGTVCFFDQKGVMSYLCVLQGIAWSVLFAFVVGPERKAFAANSLLTMLICLAMSAVDFCGMIVINALIIGPFLLSLILAGPANVARLPFLGPMVVRFFLGEWDVRNLCVRRSLPGSPRFSMELRHVNSGDSTADVFGRREDSAEPVRST